MISDSDYEWHIKFPLKVPEDYPFQGTGDTPKTFPIPHILLDNAHFIDSIESLVVKNGRLAGGSVERLVERFTLKHMDSDDMTHFLACYGCTIFLSVVLHI